MFIIISFCPTRRIGWIAGVGLLGNSSASAGRGDHGGTAGQNYGLVCEDFFFNHTFFTTFHTHFSLFTFVVRFFSYFILDFNN